MFMLTTHRRPTRKFLNSGIPVLGICYGHQFMAHNLGGRVAHAEAGEYGKMNIKLDVTSDLFSGHFP